MNSTSPLVSIIMITYNHEQYIEEAMDGVFMQEYKGNIEVILANDKSTDNTHNIISSRLRDHPLSHWVKYHNHAENKGVMGNLIWAIEQCQGKYIAICEGDDSWTDPLKLQKQVDFLEGHPDYNMTVGRYQFFYQNSGKFKNNIELFNIDKPLSLKNYIAFNFGHTSTFLFRNNIEIPEWLPTVFAGDQSVFILSTKDKKIKYFSDFFSVYRVNDGGVTNFVKSEKSFNNTKNFLNIIDKYTDKKYHLLITNRKRLNKLYYHFESTGNKLMRNIIRVPILFFRWWGINVLVNFIKD